MTYKPYIFTNEQREKSIESKRKNFEDKIIGQKFGRLIVTRYIQSSDKRNARVLCKCDCGNSKIILMCNVKSLKVKSCGCLNSEKIKKMATREGQSTTSEYYSWRSLKHRCYNTKRHDYPRYGGRGITVCESWLDVEYGFLNFFKDMGKKPTKDHSIDRINNDGNYEPSNCRWATKSEQACNRRKRIKLKE